MKTYTNYQKFLNQIEEVKKLEAELAQYVGAKYCITCANGTDALEIALMAFDIKEGDAVFVPTFTFYSTSEVVSLRGATPIFIDVDERTFNIDGIIVSKRRFYRNYRENSNSLIKCIIDGGIYSRDEIGHIEKVLNGSKEK